MRYNEPSYVKYEKIDILALIANETSVNDIIAELSEYASGPCPVCPSLFSFPHQLQVDS